MYICHLNKWLSKTIANCSINCITSRITSCRSQHPYKTCSLASLIDSLLFCIIITLNTWISEIRKLGHLYYLDIKLCNMVIM